MYHISKNNLDDIIYIIYSTGSMGDFLTSFIQFSYIDQYKHLNNLKIYNQFVSDNHLIEKIINKNRSQKSYRWRCMDSAGNILHHEETKVNNFLKELCSNKNISLEKSISILIANFNSIYWIDNKLPNNDFIYNLDVNISAESDTPFIINSHFLPIMYEKFKKSIDPLPNIRLYQPIFKHIWFKFLMLTYKTFNPLKLIQDPSILGIFCRFIHLDSNLEIYKGINNDPVCKNPKLYIEKILNLNNKEKDKLAKKLEQEIITGTFSIEIPKDKFYINNNNYIIDLDKLIIDKDTSQLKKIKCFNNDGPITDAMLEKANHDCLKILKEYDVYFNDDLSTVSKKIIYRHIEKIRSCLISNQLN